MSERRPFHTLRLSSITAGCLLLLLGVAPVQAGVVDGSRPACARQESLVLVSNPLFGGLHQALPTAGGLQTGIEVLDGQRAIDYIQSKRALHPERFSRSGEALREAGYRPTPVVTVIRAIQVTAAMGPDGSLSPNIVPATTMSNAEGELILSAWDDGDDSTWEGSIYAERYSDGRWVAYDAQWDISSTEYWYAIWSELTGYDSGGPGGGGPWEAGLAEQSTGIQLASVRQPSIGKILPARWVVLNDTHPFLDCWAPLSAGCIVTCAFTGPALGPCINGCAAGAAVYCAIEVWLK